MKTITSYRQAAVHKKPKTPKTLYLLTLALLVSFIAGAMVGATTHLVQEVVLAVGTGPETFQTLYGDFVSREVPRLKAMAGNLAQRYFDGVGPDYEFLVGP